MNKIKGFVLIILVFLVGLWVGHRSIGNSKNLDSHLTEKQEKTWWTCSMHPQIKLPKPGKCPICGMDLIPLENDTNENDNPRVLKMSPSAEKLAEIQTSQVKQKIVEKEVRMAGKIAFDETRVKTITAWISGRIDRLYVDYTGIKVHEGDHLASIYSPELLTAQEELIEAKKRVNESEGQKSDFLSQSNINALESAREKLRLWGFEDDQVKNIESENKSSDHMLITAPIGGVVIHKWVSEGEYVQTGSKIYQIADLSQLWVLLDAYESDLAWLRYGQEVQFETEAYPGEIFKGKIVFIDPTLNTQTRTTKIRVNIDNIDGKLKPDMFVRAIAFSELGEGGKVIDDKLIGQWICPMHPEIIKDHEGQCDICQMNLVRAENMSHRGLNQPIEESIVVPVSAVLVTGKRSVVYVQLMEQDQPTYEGREIVLGARAGDYYLVQSGLSVGDMVVTNGQFKIDSALQIQAKPSMMSMKEDQDSYKIFNKELMPLFKLYFSLSLALASDDLLKVEQEFSHLSHILSNIDDTSLNLRDLKVWDEYELIFQEQFDSVKNVADINKMRLVFEIISQNISKIIEYFGPAHSNFYEMYCPMAFDGKGAYWIQNKKEIQNPYLGSSMTSCGSIEKQILKIEE